MSAGPAYVLPHGMRGEGARLRLMSGLLDPMCRRHVEALGLGPGWRCLEVGAGNGSMSEWMAHRLGATGEVLCTDVDTSLLDGVRAPNLMVRALDVVSDPLPDDRDLVLARAILHHLPQRDEVVARLAGTLRPGGAILLVEPDFQPALAAEPAAARRTWEGFVAWATNAGIDYGVGRDLPARLQGLGLVRVGGEVTILHVQGGAPAGEYWDRSLAELGPGLLEGGRVAADDLEATRRLLADPGYWTMVCGFTAAWGFRPS